MKRFPARFTLAALLCAGMPVSTAQEGPGKARPAKPPPASTGGGAKPAAGGGTSAPPSKPPPGMRKDPRVCAGEIGYAIWDQRRKSYTLHAMTEDGSQSRQIGALPDHSAFLETFPWSPDGRRIVFRSDLTANPRWSPATLTILDLESGRVVPLPRKRLREGTTESGMVADGSALWSPDGSRLAFESGRDSKSDGREDFRVQPFVMNADGSGLRRLLPTQYWAANGLTWSPDGRRIAFSMSTDDFRVLASVGGDGAGLGTIVRADVQRVLGWSPDGGWIAFATETKGGEYELQIVAPDGTGKKRLGSRKNPHYEFARAVWSPDSTRLLIDYGVNLASELTLVDVPRSRMAPLLPLKDAQVFAGRGILGMAWSPGGDRIIFSLTNTSGPELYGVRADGTDLRRFGPGAFPFWPGRIAPTKPPSPPPKPPDPRPAPDADAQREEMDRVFDVFRRARRMEQRIADVTAQVRLQAVAVAGLRKRIDLLERASRDGGLTEEARADAAGKLPELRRELTALLEEQDRTIAQVQLEYRELGLWLDDARKRTSTPSLRTRVKEAQDTLEESGDLLGLQLYLAAGRREKFDETARDLVSRGVRTAAVYRMRAVEYLQHGEPRAALYALRKAMELSPDHPVAKGLIRDVEVGYLRAIAAKSWGDAAEVRAKFDEALLEKGQPGWWNALKDVVTTGVPTSLAALAGKFDDLAAAVSAEADLAAAEQAGIQVLLRLRRKGRTFDEIRALSADEFAAALGELAPVGKDAALRLRAAAAVALQNPDVRRLLAPNREQFDLDRGRSYYATDAFDVTWTDHLGEAANVVNVLSLLPGATIGRAAKAGAAAEVVETERTVGAAMSSAMNLERLAGLLEHTAAGRVLMKDFARFEARSGVVSKMLLQTLIDEGLVQAGAALGGDAGELAAQILTSAGATDLDETLSRLWRRGVPAGAVGKLAERAEARIGTLRKVRAVPEADGAALDDALRALRKGPLPTEQAERLRAAAGEAARSLRASLDLPAGPRGDVRSAEIHRRETVREALEAAADGRRGHAESAAREAAEIGQSVAEEAARLETTAVALQTAADRAKKKGPPPRVTLVPAEPASIGSATPAVPAGAGAPPVQDTLAPRGAKAAAPLADTAAPGAARSSPPGEIVLRGPAETKAADDALRLGDLDAAEHRYAAELETANEESTRYLHERLAQIAEIRKIRADQEAARKIGAAERLNRRVMEPFGEDDLARVGNLELRSLKEILSEEGVPSKNHPRWILDPDAKPGPDGARPKWGVFKPSTEGGADLDREMVAYELARELGIDAPAVARVTLQGPEGPVDGIVVRYIHESADFVHAGDAELLQAKRELARGRAFRAWIGDYDPHEGNFRRTVDGRVFSIDHGQADFDEAQFARTGVALETQRGKDVPFEAVVAGWIDYKLDLPARSPRREGLTNRTAFIQPHMVYDEMGDVVKSIRELPKNRLEDALRRGFGGGPEAEAKVRTAMEVLSVRRDVLEGVLRAKFPAAGPQ